MKSRGSDHSASPAPPRVTIPEPDASASQQPRDLARRATPKSGEAEVTQARERLQRAVDEGNKIWAGMAYSFAPRIHVLRADLAMLLAAERSMEKP